MAAAGKGRWFLTRPPPLDAPSTIPNPARIPKRHRSDSYSQFTRHRQDAASLYSAHETRLQLYSERKIRGNPLSATRNDEAVHVLGSDP